MAETPIHPRREIAIVGGGASGALMAAHLGAVAGSDTRVTLIEKGDLLGCGLAYATTDPVHLLNTRSHNMSAFPDDPDHFLGWLSESSGEAAEHDAFITRNTYGRYLAELVRTGTPNLTCIRDEVVAIEPAPGGGFRLALQGRAEALTASEVILATGHAMPATEDNGALSMPWEAWPDDLPDGPVLIVGTGLTMVDQVLTMLRQGRGRPIVAMSRRGWLPQAHAPAIAPLAIDPAALPRGAGSLSRAIRALIGKHVAAGGDWREVVDGMRPHLRGIWAGMPLSARRSFVRHAATLWDIHRHRMPPSSAETLRQAMADGRLHLWRGRFNEATREGGAGGGIRVRWTDRAGTAHDDRFTRVIDCRGIRRDPERHATPLAAHLLRTGQARIDPLRLGLDVAADCRVLDAAGAPQPGLYAIGPASRAAFWEITAIPDIRVQVADLARRI